MHFCLAWKKRRWPLGPSRQAPCPMLQAWLLDNGSPYSKTALPTSPVSRHAHNYSAEILTNSHRLLRMPFTNQH